MKGNCLISARQLKEIAANIYELATLLESNKKSQCVQNASYKTKKLKNGRLDLDIAIKFSLSEEGDINEVEGFK